MLKMDTETHKPEDLLRKIYQEILQEEPDYDTLHKNIPYIKQVT